MGRQLGSRRLLFIGLVVLLLGAVMAGCQRGGERIETAGEPIKIGAVFAITGPASPLGTPERDTALLIQDKINEAGGLDGRPVEIIIKDTKSKETDCVLAVKQLIEEGVVAIVGPSQTGTSLAVLDTVSRAEIPLVSCAAGVSIVQPVNKWVFKTAQSDVHAVAKLIDYLKEQGISKVAMISVANAYGDGGKQQLREQVKPAGITIVAEESFGDKDTDMTSQLTRIKGKNPEAVVCWGTNPGPAIVAKNMKQLGMKIPLLMSHGIANKKFIELAGPAADGVIFPAGRLIVASEIGQDDPQKAVLLEYTDAFRAKFEREPDTFGGHAWDAIYLVLEAVKEVGTDSVKIRDYIESTQGFVGIGGVFGFAAEEHNGLTKDAFVMVTITDGEWKLLK